MGFAESGNRCHAVILAGGRGVRFWPRSRVRHPKQLLAPLGGPTLLRRTFKRLSAIFAPERIWILTGEPLLEPVTRELGEVPPEHIVCEPVQRNTAPAIGLAAALLCRDDPEAVMGVFPADHHFERERAYRALVVRALEGASGDRLIVLGIKPRWPETGYGYLELPEGTLPGSSCPVPVKTFREKPDLDTARSYLAAERFYWNSGQFFWRASVVLEEMERYLPRTRRALKWIVAGKGDAYRARLAERYADCDSISIDYGILERSDRVAAFATPDLGWSDLGSWGALHALLPKDSLGNSARGGVTFLRSRGNLVDVPSKHVALLGVDDLVLVETPDALLVCRREESQGVAAVVAALAAAGRNDLL